MVTSASSAQSAYPSSNANDSDTTSSRWCATLTDTDPFWQVSLGSSYDLTGTELRWADARVYGYAISISADGSSWQEVVDKRANSSSAQTQYDALAATARYVRIAITSRPDATTAACLVDFAVFGTPAQGGSGGTAASTGGASAAGGSTGGVVGQGGTADGGTGALGGSGNAPTDGGSSLGGSAGNSSGTTVEFSFKLPQGVRREDVTFATTGGDLRINDSVVVLEGASEFSSVSSVDGGAVSRVGVAAEVKNVWSGGPVELGNYAHISGFIRSTDSVDAQAGSLVDGNVIQYTSLGRLETVRWTVEFPGTNQGSATLQPAEQRPIDPGAYAATTINRDAHLQLRSGTYSFDSLMVESGGFLDIDNSAGPVFVYLRDGFTFHGSITRSVVRPNVLFGIAGTGAVPIEAPFAGIVVAPWAKVILATTTGHRGSFFAQALEAHQATPITHEAFQPTEFCAPDAPCSSFCPCGAGESTCIGDEQCEVGLLCSANGICGCQPNCAGKGCGDDSSDGCGSICPAVCADGEIGCTETVQCHPGSECVLGGGPQKGFPSGTNVCLPTGCVHPDPTQPNCGFTASDCGACPACTPDCAAKECGFDGCGGECGTVPPDKVCILGHLVSPRSAASEHSTSFPRPLVPGYTPPSQEVGALPGLFSVTDRGSAHYSIPIEVPPGIRGIEPRLSLNYTSTRADGMLGVGWSLGGLSHIERCMPIADLDGMPAPIRLDQSDPLCLDGQRLIRDPNVTLPGVSGAAELAPTRTHYTELETFQAIAALGPETDSTGKYVGPAGFKVWTKDGRILTYGQVPSMVPVEAPATDSIVMTGGVRAAWHLSQVQDRRLNSMVIHYERPDWSREMLPSWIAWGGRGYGSGCSPTTSIVSCDRLIEFTYQDRPDQRTIRRLGEETTLAKLLTEIHLSVAGQPVSRYYLNYQNPADGVGSRIESVSACHHAASGSSCTPATLLSYAPKATRVPGFATVREVPLSAPGPTADIRAVFDWNGDGADDLLVTHAEGTTEPTYVYWKARGSGTQWSVNGVQYGTVPYSRPLVIDMDQDGRDDLLYPTGDAPKICRSIPSGLNCELLNWEFRPEDAVLADVNGDGLKDLVSCDLVPSVIGGVFLQAPRPAIRLNNGVGIENSRAATLPAEEGTCHLPLVIDYDGDGVDELMRYDSSGGVEAYDFERGTFAPIPFPNPVVTYGYSYGNGDYWTGSVDIPNVPRAFLYVLDVDGDGLKDLFYAYHGLRAGLTHSDRWLWLNRGSSFEARWGFVEEAPDQVYLEIMAGRALVDDVNQDGREDLAIPMLGGALVATGYALVWTEGVTARLDSRAAKTVVGDFDGDGANEWAALVPVPLNPPQAFPQNLQLQVLDGRRAEAGLMTRIMAGTNEITIEYDPVSSVTSHQTMTFEPNITARQGGTGTVPVRRMGPLVSRHTESQVLERGDIDTGCLGSESRYIYRGGQASRLGRGWMGFDSRYIFLHDDRGQEVEHTAKYFHNDQFWRAGLVQSSTTTSPLPLGAGDHHFNWPRTLTTDNSWMLHSTSGLSDGFVWLDRESSYVADYWSRTTNWTPDEYGNVVLAQTRVCTYDSTDCETTQVFNTIYPDTAGWCLDNPEEQYVNEIRDSSSMTRITGFVYDHGLLQDVVREPYNPDHLLTTHYDRDSAGNVIKTTQTDANNTRRASDVIYDSRYQFPIFLRNSKGHVTEVEYDDATGALLTSMDPNGIVTQWGYDPLHRLVQMVTPTDTVAVSYGSGNGDTNTPELGQTCPAVKVQTTSPGNGSSTEVFDGKGRLLRSVGTALNGAEALQEHWYDWAGRRVKSTLPRPPGEPVQGVVSYGYDPLGRMTSETGPDGRSTEYEYVNSSNAAPEVTEFFQGGGGEAVLRTNPGNSVDVTISDIRGRTMQVRRYESAVDVGTPGAEYASTAYTHNVFGDVETVTDADGDVTNIMYDDIGRKKRVMTTATGWSEYQYNGFDEVTRDTDGAGKTRCHSYDDLGRLVAIRRGSGTVCSSSDPLISSWEYDGAGPNETGRLMSAYRERYPGSGTGVTLRYHYKPNGAGQLDSIDRELPFFGKSLTTSFDYVGSRLSVVHYPAPAIGQAFDVKYDYHPTSGNLIRVSNPATDESYWDLAETDQGMRIKRERFGNGVETEYGYYTYADSIGTCRAGATACVPGALRSIQVGKPGATEPIQRYEYAYDRADNVRYRFSRDQSRPGEVVSEIFLYDGHDRLRSHQTSRASIEYLAYSYTPGGNITSVALPQSVPSETYTYDPNRPQLATALTTAGGTYTYGYDPAGNQISRSGPTVPGGSQTLDYDDFDLPWQITNAGSGPTLLTYDADQSRIVKQASDFTTLYAGDFYECVGTTPAASGSFECSEHRYKVYAGSVLIAEVSLDAGGSVTQKRFIHTDHLGSSTIVTSESGDLAEERRFEPFGQPSFDFSNTSVRSGFTGHEHDPEFGLINMRGRLYDPTLRRFVSADPYVTEPFNTQGMNRYAYVQNNPVNAVDPSGFGTLTCISDTTTGYSMSCQWQPSPEEIAQYSRAAMEAAMRDAAQRAQSSAMTSAAAAAAQAEAQAHAQANAAAMRGSDEAAQQASAAAARMQGSGLFNNVSTPPRDTSGYLAAIPCPKSGCSDAMIYGGTAMMPGPSIVVVEGAGAAKAAAALIPRLVRWILGKIGPTKAARGAAGTINITERGIAHVLARHVAGGAGTAGKSLFSGGAQEVRGLIEAAGRVAPTAQAGGNLARVVDAGRAIGIDRATGQATSMYTVITNTAGDLVTAFPGIP